MPILPFFIPLSFSFSFLVGWVSCFNHFCCAQTVTGPAVSFMPRLDVFHLSRCCMKRLFVYLFAGSFECRASVRRMLWDCRERISRSQCENLKKKLVYIPNILARAAFTTSLISCQTYNGDWSHSTQLLAVACDCFGFLIPVFPRQSVEHQG